jgi:hypothetical protein
MQSDDRSFWQSLLARRNADFYPRSGAALFNETEPTVQLYASLSYGVFAPPLGNRAEPTCPSLSTLASGSVGATFWGLGFDQADHWAVASELLTAWAGRTAGKSADEFDRDDLRFISFSRDTQSAGTTKLFWRTVDVLKKWNRARINFGQYESYASQVSGSLVEESFSQPGWGRDFTSIRRTLPRSAIASIWDIAFSDVAERLADASIDEILFDLGATVIALVEQHGARLTSSKTSFQILTLAQAPSRLDEARCFMVFTCCSPPESEFVRGSFSRPLPRIPDKGGERNDQFVQRQPDGKIVPHRYRQIGTSRCGGKGDRAPRLARYCLTPKRYRCLERHAIRKDHEQRSHGLVPSPREGQVLAGIPLGSSRLRGGPARQEEVGHYGSFATRP